MRVRTADKKYYIQGGQKNCTKLMTP